MKASNKSTTNSPSPTSAMRWWMKRRKASSSWLRPATSRSRGGSAGAPTARSAALSIAAVPSSTPTSRCGSCSRGTSPIAGARGGDAVEDVGEEVEEHDHPGGDHEPGLHGVDVGRERPLQSPEQELSHPLPAEDDLRDHRSEERRVGKECR